MKKSILVTGVAGSGKSLIAEHLNKFGHKAYDIEEIGGLFEMIDKDTGKKFEDYDNDNLEIVKRGAWICDKEKLRALIENEKSEIAFYCGTASNLEELLPLFDAVVLLKANHNIIRKRLKMRKSKDYGNTEEVQNWLLSWEDQWEDEVQDKGAIVVSAAGNPEDIAKKIMEIAFSLH